MSNRKKIVIAVSIVLLIVIILVIRRNRKRKEGSNELNKQLAAAEQSNTSNPLTSSSEANYNVFPLMFGSKGDNVLRLQRALNKISPENKITEDGDFGNGTRLKLITSLPTSMYSLGPKVTEVQLNAIIAKGNLI